jgi:hypothetical protein
MDESYQKVSVIDERIILVETPSELSAAELRAYFRKIEGLTETWHNFSIVLTFPDGFYPNSELRSIVREEFALIKQRVNTLAIVLPKPNIALKVVFQFIALATGFYKYAIFPDLDTAIAASRTANQSS